VRARSELLLYRVIVFESELDDVDLTRSICFPTESVGCKKTNTRSHTTALKIENRTQSMQYRMMQEQT